MAGRARRNALQAELERRAIETFALAPDPDALTTLDYVCDWLENGRTAKELALELTNELEFELQATALRRFLVECFTEPVVNERLDASYRKSSPALAESSLAIVDEDADTNVQVSRAASRARTRQWLAARYDPSRFGDQKQQGTTINIGTLHLQALQHVTTDMNAGNGPTKGARLLPAPARLIGTHSDSDSASNATVVSQNTGKHPRDSDSLLVKTG